MSAPLSHSAVTVVYLASKASSGPGLNPGDTIPVPGAVLNGSVLAGLRDWTQILSPLAPGAAPVNVLR